MELLDNLWLGLRVASEPSTLAYCFFGVFLGTLVGVLPGIGALAAISLLLPITYHIPPRRRSSCWPASTTAPSTGAPPRRSC